MERESGMVKWNKFNDAENSRDINEIEQYVNSELVVHSEMFANCLLYTSPSPRDYAASRMPSSA